MTLEPAASPTTLDSFVRAVASTPAVEPALGPGAVLGDGYEVRERLGTGGMAMVYRAYDRRLGRDVAIKVPRLRGDDEARAQLRRMFEREARTTASLNHPGIVTLHHVGDHGGTPFLVLELLTGETLAARLDRRGTLPAAEALEILDGVLAALAHAHDRGLVHRDLTPRNVFLTADQRVKVLDFGVAVASDAAPGTVTRAAGTPGYMAPEHGAGDARSDLWAAAVLFVECTTGRRPAAASPPDASQLPAGVPAAVQDVVRRALSPDPADRPTTASDMRAALAPVLAPLRPVPVRRRRRLVLAAAALAVVAAVAGGAFAAGAFDTGAAPRTIVPKSGRWRGDPSAESPWEYTLQQTGPSRFAYQARHLGDGVGWGGTLELERLADGTTVLRGKLADLRTCPTCTKVGMIELIVLDETSVYQNKAAWGWSHDAYVEWFPPYRFKYAGTIAEGAR